MSVREMFLKSIKETLRELLMQWQNMSKIEEESKYLVKIIE